MKKYAIMLILVGFFGMTTGVFAATTTKKTSAKSSTKTITKPLESIFYYIPGKSAFASIQSNADKITTLAPQAYTVNESGELKGSLSAQATELITKNNIKLMPLIANQGFSQTIIHTILVSPELQNKVVDQLITEAQVKNYIGWQFDFERIPATDRDAYSAFVEHAANKFKANKLKFSVAILGRTSEKAEDLPPGSWDNWSGVYDYKRIGKAADFVTLMAYDMPDSMGPVTSMNWIKKTLAYVKKSIPANKISLGIPTYGWQWDVDDPKDVVKVKSVSWDKINTLITQKAYDKIGFDSTVGEAWITYTEKFDYGSIKYKIWFENDRSFKMKHDFAKAQKLQGISLWALGLEDPKMWSHFKSIARS